MGFKEDIDRLAEQLRHRSDHVGSEEGVKQALVLPVLATLGYDIYDPREVQPEYVADFAIKRAGQLEKVDYAVRRDGTTVMFVEAKRLGQSLAAHDDQLARYFNATPTVRVAILTNGLRWRFFTDLRQPNIMDPTPFLEFDFQAYRARDVEALEPFRKENFAADLIVQHAEELTYVEELTDRIAGLLRSPSEPFVRFLIKESGFKQVVTAKVVDRFDPLVRKATQMALVSLMTRSIQQEIAPAQASTSPPAAPPAAVVAEPEARGRSRRVPSPAVPDPPQQPATPMASDGGEPEASCRAIVTTPAEVEALAFVKDLCSGRAVFDLPVEGKDATGYYALHCGKANWWFMRLFWDARRPTIVTRLPTQDVRQLAPGFEVEDAPSGQGISRIYVEGIRDLQRLTDLIVRCYEEEAKQHLFGRG